MRSSPALSALRRASAVDTTPTCSPFSSTRRTWGEVIISFTRGPSREGVLSKGGRAIAELLVPVIGFPWQAIPGPRVASIPAPIGRDLPLKDGPAPPGPAQLSLPSLFSALKARHRARSEEHTSELQSLMRIS